MRDPVLDLEVVLLDKPAGPTSHDLVMEARRALRHWKIGHAGTLDPFATGLLVLGMGRTTRLLEYLTGLDKEYEATARLGVATNTHDLDGTPLASDDNWLSLQREDVVQAAMTLTGTLAQSPPAYSAVKVRGVPAHRRTRRGEKVELPPRTVTIYEMEVLRIELPEVDLRVSCSSGTYMRSLAADFGRQLGTGCHLTALRRSRVGSFRVEDAAQPADLQSWPLPPGSALSGAVALAHLPALSVKLDEAKRIASGQQLPCDAEDLEQVAIVAPDNRLVAVGSVADGRLRPRKVFWRG